ncbi:Dihydroorotase [Bienertia sinuspersici]
MRLYIFISRLPVDVYKNYVEDINIAHLAGFTFVMVNIVHLAGSKILEENLWHHAKQMGLQETNENHPALGSVKVSLDLNYIYLQKDKVNGPKRMYELAERALDQEASIKN